MSFFKKFFFKDEQKVMIKSPARIQGDFLNRIKFEVELENTSVGFLLHNVSQNGLAFFLQSFKKSFKVDNTLKCKITCGDKSVSFQTIIVRVTGELVGAKIISNNIDYGLLIRHYFKLELAALTSTVINSNRLDKDPDGIPTWVVSGDNCELFFVVNEQLGLAKYHITLFGNVIQRDKSKCLHYQEIWSEDVSENVYKGSDLLKDLHDDFLVSELVTNAISFVGSLKNIDEGIKELITCELKLALKKL